MQINEIIALALSYAESHLALEVEDETFFTNILLDHFGAKEPYKGPIDRKKIADMKVPDAVFDAIVKYDVEVRLWDPLALSAMPLGLGASLASSLFGHQGF